jgi:hypothetical protein
LAGWEVRWPVSAGGVSAAAAAAAPGAGWISGCCSLSPVGPRALAALDTLSPFGCTAPFGPAVSGGLAGDAGGRPTGACRPGVGSGSGARCRHLSCGAKRTPSASLPASGRPLGQVGAAALCCLASCCSSREAPLPAEEAPPPLDASAGSGSDSQSSGGAAEEASLAPIRIGGRCTAIGVLVREVSTLAIWEDGRLLSVLVQVIKASSKGWSPAQGARCRWWTAKIANVTPNSASGCLQRIDPGGSVVGRRRKADARG